MNFRIIYLILFSTQMVFGQGKTDSLLSTLYTKGRINGNILIAQKGNIIYQKSFGLRNENSGEHLDEDSIFDLASITKQFTAAGIVLLKEQGKLSFDDPVSKYIPELQLYPSVTIRHLLQHTSGLPDYMEHFEINSHSTISNKDIIEFLSTRTPELRFEPNSRWEYSNTGYVVLAVLMERISNMSFARFLAQNIFQPLGMDKAYLPGEKSSEFMDNFAIGYVYSDSLNQWIDPHELNEFAYLKGFQEVVGDGGLRATAGDLLKWDRALYANQLFSEDAKKEMFSPAILNDGSTFPYGFGWDLHFSKDFGTMVSHGGSWAGYITYIERHLDNDITIIVLQNHEDAEMVHKPLRYLIYGLPLPNHRKEIQLTEEQIHRILGVYEIQKGMEFKITYKGGDIYARMTNQPSIRIYPESETTFFLKEFEASLHFEADHTGMIHRLIVQQGEHQSVAHKIRN